MDDAEDYPLRMTFYLQLPSRATIHCRDPHQALLLARVFTAITTGRPLDEGPVPLGPHLPVRTPPPSLGDAGARGPA